MKNNEVKNQEDVIMEEILSSKEINLKNVSDKDIKIYLKKKIVEANYLNEEWKIHYAAEKIFENIRKYKLKGKKLKRGLANASLIFAIISNIPSTAGIVAGIVAVVCGHLALHKIKKDSNLYTGKGAAIAGLILGYLGLAIGLFLVIMKSVIRSKLGY